MCPNKLRAGDGHFGDNWLLKRSLLRGSERERFKKSNPRATFSDRMQFFFIAYISPVPLPESITYGQKIECGIRQMRIDILLNYANVDTLFERWEVEIRSQ